MSLKPLHDNWIGIHTVWIHKSSQWLAYTQSNFGGGGEVQYFEGRSFLRMRKEKHRTGSLIPFDLEPVYL